MTNRSFFVNDDTDAQERKAALPSPHVKLEDIDEKNFMDTQTVESILNFSEESSLGFRGLESKFVFAELERRYTDLLAAMQWFIDQERTDEALRLATSLPLFWMATKRLDEGSAWFERIQGLPGGDNINRGEAFFQAGLLAFWQGDDDRASALHNQALTIGRQASNPTIMAEALSGLARIALRSDHEEARRLCREALAITEGTDDQRGRSNAIHVLGVAAQMAGDFIEARELMSQRIASARELGNYYVISAEAGNLSMVERQLGNLDQAEALVREALEIDQRRGDHWAMPYKVNGLAAVFTERRDYERAATLVGIAESMMEAEKASWPPDERPHYEWMVDTLTRAMGLIMFERARGVGHSMTSSDAVDFALGSLSNS